MVKVGLTLWVSARPIAQPTTVLFYDRSERKLRAPRCARVRAEWQRDSNVELHVIGRDVSRNDRRVGQFHGGHALTIGVEAVNRPLPRWREIELIVPRRFAGAQESLKARVFPQFVGGTRSSYRADANTRHVGS